MEVLLMGYNFSESDVAEVQQWPITVTHRFEDS